MSVNSVFAQGMVREPLSGKLSYSATLWEYPYQAEGDFYRFPSMQQAQDITFAWYQTGNYLIYQYVYPQGVAPSWLASFAFHYISFYTPFGIAWMHEEWHRSVLAAENISSVNQVNEFPFGEPVIKVHGVEDAALAEFKKENPSGFVRMSAAGMESVEFLNEKYSREIAMHGRNYAYGVAMLVGTVTNLSYMEMCRSGRQNDAMYAYVYKKEETSNEKDRDFTGLDCTAWTYDLHRPREDYAVRGVHPSGSGVDRYIHYDELKSSEKGYLQRVANRSYISLLNPMMWRIDPFSWGGASWTLAMFHYLTSFGESTDTRLYFNSNPVKMILTGRVYNNPVRSSGGMEAELYDYPVGKLYASLRLAFWSQPRTGISDVTVESGLIAVGVNFPVSPTVLVTTTTEYKGPGWEAGNVYLQENLSFRTGLQWNIP